MSQPTKIAYHALSYGKGMRQAQAVVDYIQQHGEGKYEIIVIGMDMEEEIQKRVQEIAELEARIQYDDGDAYVFESNIIERDGLVYPEAFEPGSLDFLVGKKCRIRFEVINEPQT